MALIDKKILTPMRHHQDNANTVIGQASTMKALFDQGAEDLRVKLNGVIDELLATTGAQQIGIDPARGLGNTLADALTNIKNYMNLGASGISATTIGTGSGNTVQSQLEWLLLQIQNVVLNQIPEGTISIDKLTIELADLINGHTTQLAQNASDLNEHKAEIVSQVVVGSRDLSLAGIQIVSGFTRKPKSLTVLAVKESTKIFSIGVQDQNNYGRCMAFYGIDIANALASVIGIGVDYTNYVRGIVTINNDKTISINWDKIGEVAGTVQFRILAHYHGGD